MSTMRIPRFTAENVFHRTGTHYQGGPMSPLRPAGVVQPAAEPDCGHFGNWTVCCGWLTCCAIHVLTFQNFCFDNPVNVTQV